MSSIQLPFPTGEKSDVSVDENGILTLKGLKLSLDSGTVPRGGTLRCFDGVNFEYDTEESGEILRGTSGSFNEYEYLGLGWGLYDDGYNKPYIRNISGSNMFIAIDYCRMYADNSSEDRDLWIEDSWANQDYRYFFSGNNFDSSGDHLSGRLKVAGSVSQFKLGNYYDIEFTGIVDEVTTDSIRWFFRRIR